MRRALFVWILTALGLGCAGSTDANTVTVFAASSLTDAFSELEASFEAEHPGVNVVVSTAGSQTLRHQLERGAPAGVFASANGEHMRAVRDAGIVSESAVFTHGEMVLVVPADNPAGLERFEDLPRASRVVLAAPDVPAGAYARAILERAGELTPGFSSRVAAKVVSNEPNVRLVLAKVELGEADAALVYRSDVTASRDVRVFEVPDALGSRAAYHIGVVESGAGPDWSARFVAHVRSDAGQDTLHRHGFVGR